MAKLIKILVASVGGGLMLGAGIRLGEALAAQLPAEGSESGRKLAEKIGELEHRLLSLEVEIPAALTEPGPQLLAELGDWLEENVAVRMADVETRLRAESERGQKQMLDAFAESVQTRVVQRISRLEEEVAGQSAAMSELRECSLRTERSMQQLLGGLDRLIVKSPPVSEAFEAAEAGADPSSADARVVAPNVSASAESGPPPGGDAPAAGAPAAGAPAADVNRPAVVEPPAFEARPKSRRWKFFG